MAVYTEQAKFNLLEQVAMKGSSSGAISEMKEFV
jgi:hypothetical protein